MMGWNGDSETDFYSYACDVFVNVFGYPRDHVRLTEKGSRGKIP